MIAFGFGFCVGALTMGAGVCVPARYYDDLLWRFGAYRRLRVQVRLFGKERPR